MQRMNSLVDFGAAKAQSGRTDGPEILAETTLGGWLREVAGYENPADGFAKLQGKQVANRRPWCEVKHATSGELVSFHCSKSGNHDLETVAKTGLSLRMLCVQRNDGSAWWFTGKPGDPTKGVKAVSIVSLADMQTEGDAPAESTEDLPF